MRLRLDMVIKYLFGFLDSCIRCKEIISTNDLLTVKRRSLLLKKILILLIAFVLVAFDVYQEQGRFNLGGLLQRFEDDSGYQENSNLQRAYENKQSNFQIRGEGVVLKVLRDDLKGSRHQKFILKGEAGQTVLVAHNIDLAPRIDGLKKGDRVEYFGEYEWNSRGGIIHWTHKDPKGYHASGWLKYNGRTYQ